MVADNDNSAVVPDVTQDPLAKRAFALGVESMRLQVMRWLEAERETLLAEAARKVLAPPMEAVQAVRPDGIKVFQVAQAGDAVFPWRAWRPAQRLRGLGLTEEEAVADLLDMERRKRGA